MSAEEDYKARIVQLTQLVENLHALTGSEIEQQIRTALDDMDAIVASPRPDRRFLEALIDKIIIHSDRTVEFVLKTDIESTHNHNLRPNN